MNARRIKRQYFVSGCLLVLGLFALMQGMEPLIAWSGMGHLNKANDQYLEDSFNKSLKGFIILSTIKSGVAVLEGSEVGVGFNLELGDVAQSIYDYVDVAWKTVLAGSTILLLVRLVLNTIESIDHYFLAFLFAALAFQRILAACAPRAAAAHQRAREVVVLFMMVTLSLYVLIPGAVAGATYLSKRITRPLVEEATGGFASVQNDISWQALRESLLPEGENGLANTLNLAEHYRRAKEGIKEIASRFEGLTSRMAAWTIKLVAGYLFDCILFPVTFFAVMFFAFQWLVRYLGRPGWEDSSPQVPHAQNHKPD